LIFWLGLVAANPFRQLVISSLITLRTIPILCHGVYPYRSPQPPPPGNNQLPVSKGSWIFPALFPTRTMAFGSPPGTDGAAGGSVAAAGETRFLAGLFNCFAGFARALLNPAEQFLLFAFNVLEIIIRELRPSLFQLALGDVPVASDFKCRHNDSFCFGCLFSFTANGAVKFICPISCAGPRTAGNSKLVFITGRSTHMWEGLGTVLVFHLA
jgi:hypothetical protein